MELIMENWRRFIEEEDNEYKEIDIDHDSGEGNVFGVVHNKGESIDNWIEKEDLDDKAKKAIKALELPIAILKNINVEEEHRGEGIGGELMEEFMLEASNASAYAVILIADIAEDDPSAGRNLEKWYEENYEFERVGSDGTNPVMVKKLKGEETEQ